ncbi:LysR family transcriptional regulator [Burkholderia sp. WAC0059]|uniref:LysR family transcriptional regulator n=1 Tax=Burkholderia sp. WAC0059 TaxID=2066022 RepID=UPI000C7EDF4E|nr:LysR family transcriptional regulator [Burkholderia sp. WAC0059]PLZ04330.1 LysR family transcriptional regulator [Burkholderia sp. WAC0059]
MHNVALTYFLEVARTGSLSKASERLHIAVSALSRQIAKLESEFGTPLFERRPRGMVLSEAGRLLAAHAQRAALESERVSGEIRGLTAAGRATIRVASSEGVAHDLVPRVFARFHKRYPLTHLHLEVASPTVATARVREGSADIAVCFSISPERDVSVHHAQRAPIFALVRTGHPLARRESVMLTDLAPYPLALPTPGVTLRQLFDLCSSLHGLLLEPVFLSNYHPALCNFVQQSDGVTIAGFLTVRSRLQRDQLAAVPIDHPELHQRTLQVQTMAGRTLPAPVAKFLDALIEAIREPSALDEA